MQTVHAVDLSGRSVVCRYSIGLHFGQLNQHYQVVYPDMHHRHREAFFGRHREHCALAPPLYRTWRLSQIRPSHRTCTWPCPVVAASSRPHYRLRILLLCVAHHIHSFDHSPEWDLLTIQPLRQVSNRHCWTQYRHTLNMIVFFVKKPLFNLYGCESKLGHPLWA